MSNIKKTTMDSDKDKERQKENEVNELITAEDAVQTTVYLANALDCCSGEQKLGNMLGMLGADVMDDTVYHCEDDHPKMKLE